MLGLPRLHEHLVSVDHFPIWRRHVAWSRQSGINLRDQTIQRFSSNMVFMSLLLGTTVGVLFSPSKPADAMREHLFNSDYDSYDFWAGLLICFSIPLTLCTLVATFTAWAVVSVLSDSNAHCFLRSSVGLYASQLPSRLIVLSIYIFLIWMIIFLYILLPNLWAIIVTVVSAVLFGYIISFYSSVGRLVMYTGAMGNKRIFTTQEEESMLPWELYSALLERAKQKKGEANFNVVTQYRDYDPRTSSEQRVSAQPQSSGAPQDVEEGMGSNSSFAKSSVRQRSTTGEPAHSVQTE